MNLKRKIQISIIFFFGTAILLIAFLIYPLFSEIKKTSQNFLLQKQKLIELEKKVENLEKFKIIFPEISADLEKIDNLFVNREIPVDFIRFLEKTSRDSQISLKISAVLPLEIETEPWSSILFQLVLAGPFPNVSQWLEKLESSIYLIEIQNLTITHLSETELKSKQYEQFSLGDVKATLSIKVYTK